MATRVFVIGRRNDLEGMDILVSDLQPGFQKSIYEGAPQPFYLQPGVDVPGATETQLDSYVSGSRNTTLAAGDELVADDTTGGGNDVLASPTATFGLAAYLQEKVQAGGIAAAANPNLTFAQANTVALAIMARLESGANLTWVDLNTRLSLVVPNTELGPPVGGLATGFSKSYGTVEDVIRILSGEVYARPRFIIVCNVATQFLNAAERAVLVAAQNSVLNGGSTFAASGAFLTDQQAGYEGRPVLARTGAFNISMGVGKLAMLMASVPGDSPWNAVETFTNPALAYAAVDVTQSRPRATAIDGVTAIPATGVYGAVRIYDNTGLAL